MTRNVRTLFQPVARSRSESLALLILRVIAGVAFMLHGWGKIQNPFGWMGPDSPVPGIFQALAAIAEFGGGLAWALGLLMPLASFGLFCTMVVASSMHLIVRGDPFVSKSGSPSGELATIYFAIAVLFLVFGPGRLALDKLIFGERR